MRKEQSAANILSSLLRQVVCGMETVPEEITRACQEQRMSIGRRGPRLLDIVNILQTITSSLGTFVCIDALYECAAVHRVKLLTSLHKILEKSPGTGIFIIGRPHTVFPTVQSVRLRGRTGRTMAHIPSFWGC